MRIYILYSNLSSVHTIMCSAFLITVFMCMYFHIFGTRNKVNQSEGFCMFVGFFLSFVLLMKKLINSQCKKEMENFT